MALHDIVAYHYHLRRLVQGLRAIIVVQKVVVNYNSSDLNRLEYNFRTIPSTYVISPGGNVVRYRSGAYDKATLNYVEEFFQTKLPGLNK